MDDENSLIKKLLILWRGRKIILSLSVISAVISLAYAFYLPPVYKADCNFLPPNQYMNKLGVFVSILDQSEHVGGLSNNPVMNESVTSSQMILGLMKQPSVLDKIIDRFSLMEVYEQKIRGRMREYFVKKLLEVNEDTKSGIISVGILDEDPQRAANIANALIEVLQEKILSLSRHEAEQRRIFFEKQLFSARLYLDKVQNELRDYQEQIGGVAVPEFQMEATVRSITELRQQIADKRAEISAMSTYARPTNPRLKAATSQLESMTKELQRLEATQKDSSSQLSVDYQRYTMRVQSAVKNYNSIMEKLEEARLDESQTFFQLQIVEYAAPPDVKYKPSRARIIILGTFIGFLLGCLWVTFSNFQRGLRKTMEKYSQDNPEIFSGNEQHDNDNEKRPGLLRHILNFAPALLVMAVIMLLTFQPTPASGELSAYTQSLLKIWLGKYFPALLDNMHTLRSLAHIFLYMPLSMALYYALSHYTFRSRAAFDAFIVSSVFGLADEAVKMFLPGREFDFFDWLIDAASSFAGAVLALIFAGLFWLIFRKK